MDNEVVDETTCTARVPEKMITRWYFLLLIFLAAPYSYAGEKSLHLVVLGIATPGVTIPQIRGLLAGLEEAGYVDGKNIIVHLTQAETAQQLRDKLSKLLQQKIDVIVATSARETTIAKELTNKIPIVFVPAMDPVGMGFVKSRSRPNANLTGFSFTRDVEDNGKQLAVFKQIVPAMRRVTLFYDGQLAIKTSTAVLGAVQRVARNLNIHVAEVPASSIAEATQLLDRAAKGTTDAIFVICSATFRGMAPLAERAVKFAAPLFGCTATQVAEEGALMTYAPDIYYMGYRSAWYIDRILKGATPEELPVETPSKFELVVNLKTSRRIGLTIPPEALILADKVFQ